MRCKCDLNIGWTSLECPEHTDEFVDWNEPSLVGMRCVIDKTQECPDWSERDNDCCRWKGAWSEQRD
jgi:hypothetical protein